MKAAHKKPPDAFDKRLQESPICTLDKSLLRILKTIEDDPQVIVRTHVVAALTRAVLALKHMVKPSKRLEALEAGLLSEMKKDR